MNNLSTGEAPSRAEIHARTVKHLAGFLGVCNNVGQILVNEGGIDEVQRSIILTGKEITRAQRQQRSLQDTIHDLESALHVLEQREIGLGNTDIVELQTRPYYIDAEECGDPADIRKRFEIAERNPLEPSISQMYKLPVSIQSLMKKCKTLLSSFPIKLDGEHFPQIHWIKIEENAREIYDTIYHIREDFEGSTYLSDHPEYDATLTAFLSLSKFCLSLSERFGSSEQIQDSFSEEDILLFENAFTIAENNVIPLDRPDDSGLSFVGEAQIRISLGSLSRDLRALRVQDRRNDKKVVHMAATAADILHSFSPLVTLERGAYSFPMIERMSEIESIALEILELVKLNGGEIPTSPDVEEYSPSARGEETPFEKFCSLRKSLGDAIKTLKKSHTVGFYKTNQLADCCRNINVANLRQITRWTNSNMREKLQRETVQYVAPLIPIVHRCHDVLRDHLSKFPRTYLEGRRNTFWPKAETLIAPLLSNLQTLARTGIGEQEILAEKRLAIQQRIRETTDLLGQKRDEGENLGSTIAGLSEKHEGLYKTLHTLALQSKLLRSHPNAIFQSGNWASILVYIEGGGMNQLLGLDPDLRGSVVLDTNITCADTTVTVRQLLASRYVCNLFITRYGGLAEGRLSSQNILDSLTINIPQAEHLCRQSYPIVAAIFGSEYFDIEEFGKLLSGQLFTEDFVSLPGKLGRFFTISELQNHASSLRYLSGLSEALLSVACTLPLSLLYHPQAESKIPDLCKLLQKNSTLNPEFWFSMCPILIHPTKDKGIVESNLLGCQRVLQEYGLTGEDFLPGTTRSVVINVLSFNHQNHDEVSFGYIPHERRSTLLMISPSRFAGVLDFLRVFGDQIDFGIEEFLTRVLSLDASPTSGVDLSILSGLSPKWVGGDRMALKEKVLGLASDIGNTIYSRKDAQSALLRPEGCPPDIDWSLAYVKKEQPKEQPKEQQGPPDYVLANYAQAKNIYLSRGISGKLLSIRLAQHVFTTGKGASICTILDPTHDFHEFSDASDSVLLYLEGLGKAPRQKECAALEALLSSLTLERKRYLYSLQGETLDALLNVSPSILSQGGSQILTLFDANTVDLRSAYQQIALLTKYEEAISITDFVRKVGVLPEISSGSGEIEYGDWPLLYFLGGTTFDHKFRTFWQNSLKNSTSTYKFLASLTPTMRTTLIQRQFFLEFFDPEIHKDPINFLKACISLDPHEQPGSTILGSGGAQFVRFFGTKFPTSHLMPDFFQSALAQRDTTRVKDILEGLFRHPLVFSYSIAIANVMTDEQMDYVISELELGKGEDEVIAILRTML